MNYGNKSSISRAVYETNPQYVAEKLENKIEKMMNGGEVILQEKEPIYTPKKTGVLAETDIRTDRFEQALDSVIATHKSYETRMQAAIKNKEVDDSGEPITPKE